MAAANEPEPRLRSTPSNQAGGGFQSKVATHHVRFGARFDFTRVLSKGSTRDNHF